MNKNKTKNHYIGFKLNDVEYETVLKRIHQSELSISRFMLSTALNKNIIVVPEVRSFTKELNRIGNNLNQLTVLAHKGHIETVYLNETLDALNHIYKELTRIRR